MAARETIEHEAASAIENREPWICEPVFCRRCSQEWNAVRTLQTDPDTLQCPFCGLHDSCPLGPDDHPPRHVRH
jgi:hypothetical protein